MRLVVLPFALIAALLTAGAVYWGSYGAGAFVLYLASILCVTLTVVPGGLRPGRPRITARSIRSIAPIALLVVVQLALLRYFGTFPTHFQHDEFITAYASWSLPDLTRIEWFVGYPEKGTWVCQFPILFFVLQKPFLMVFGPTVDAVRVSVWPYLVLTTVYVYLLAKELSGRWAYAFAAALCGIVFAPSLYLSSIGVHFHSSTLFLIGSVYHLVRLLRTESRVQGVVVGLYCGMAYLTYTSSYITLPLLLGYVVYESLVRRTVKPLKLFLPSLVVFVVVLLPFVVYALSVDNYFLQRAEQINSLSGKDYGQPALDYGGQALAFLLDHLASNVKALYEAGHVAKETGYLFGGQPFFSPLGLVLFAVGCLVGLYRAFFRSERGYLLVLGVVFLSFASGMVLTMPAGGFHRISLAYPFVGIAIASGAFLPLTALELGKLRRVRNWLVWPLVVVVLVGAFAVTSTSRGYQMVVPDQTHDSPLVARYIQEHVPSSDSVVVAFDPYYHLARELFFRLDGRKITSEPVPAVLADHDFDVVILAYASTKEVAQVIERYPGSRLVSTVDGVAMRDHKFLLTRGAQAGSAP